MSSEVETLNEVVGSIYEAALEATTWDDAMLRFVNSYSPPRWDVSFLLWEQAPKLGARFVAAANLAPHARDIYAMTFAGVQPWSRRIAPLPIGDVVDTDDICPRDELMASDFYKHFLANWEMTRALAAMLDRDGEQRLAWVIPGPDGFDVSRLRRGMRLVAPHLQRAVRISRRLADADLRASAAEAGLAMSVAAILALKQDCSCINANPRAQAYVDAGVGRFVDGRWRFTQAEANAELSRLANSDAPSSSAFNVIGSDGQEHAVLAVRIAPQRSSVLDGYVDGASLLVTIGSKGRAPTIPVDHLAAWYGFTPSEAFLAASLLTGESVQEFAVRRGVTENAVRFLMKGVLRKSGAADQARLVAQLRALPLLSQSVTSSA